MWIFESEQERKTRDEQQLEMFEKTMEEAREKAEARDGFIKSTTCVYCGRHDTLPPWLM
jgi:hypothetical protein